MVKTIWSYHSNKVIILFKSCVSPVFRFCGPSVVPCCILSYCTPLWFVHRVCVAQLWVWTETRTGNTIIHISESGDSLQSCRVISPLSLRLRSANFVWNGRIVNFSSTRNGFKIDGVSIKWSKTRLARWISVDSSILPTNLTWMNWCGKVSAQARRLW